jgi:hypothetical protein
MNIAQLDGKWWQGAILGDVSGAIGFCVELQVLGIMGVVPGGNAVLAASFLVNVGVGSILGAVSSI